MIMQFKKILKIFQLTKIKQQEQNRLEGALQNYDYTIQNNPENADIYFYKANTLAAMNRFKAAFENYDNAIQKNHENANFYYNKANELVDINRLEDALKCYDEAIQINPQKFIFYLNKGKTGLSSFVKQGQQSSFSYNLAIVLEKLNRFEEAFQYYDDAIQRNSNNAEINRFEEALMCYDEAIKINPHNFTFYLNKAITLKNQN